MLDWFADYTEAALHMERFAMFTLPRSVEGTEGSDCESRSTGVNLASDRFSNGCSHTNSDSDGRDQDVNMSMQALKNDMRDLQNQLEESRSATLQRPEQDATDFLRELAGIQMQVKHYEKMINTFPLSIREKSGLVEQFTELCIAAGKVKEAIGFLEQLQSLQLDSHLPATQKSRQKRLESANQVIQMVEEVDELLKGGTDIHTEPGKSRALDIFARTGPGRRHAETLWGPHIVRMHIVKTPEMEDRIRKTAEEALAKNMEDLRLWQEEAKRDIESNARGRIEAEETTEGEHGKPDNVEDRTSSTEVTSGEKYQVMSGKINDPADTILTPPKSESTMTEGGGLAQQDAPRRNPSRDEGSQQAETFSQDLSALGDQEMEEGTKQIEGEVMVFRLIFRPLLAAARSERLQEEKELYEKDVGLDSPAYCLEKEMMEFEDDVKELERQLDLKPWTSVRRKAISELTNKMRSFDWEAVETRLEQIRLERKQRQLSMEEDQASSQSLERKSNQTGEQGQIRDLLSISPEGMAELPRSDTMIINRESGDSSSAEHDQSRPPPRPSGKDGEWQTATFVRESDEPGTDRGSDPTSSPGAGDAQEGLVHKDSQLETEQRRIPPTSYIG